MNSECSGLVYRCRLSTYLGKKGEIVSTVKMVPMKRLSCPGCDHCRAVKELLKEDLIEDNAPSFAHAGDREDGALFKLVLTSHRLMGDGDWEWADTELRYFRFRRIDKDDVLKPCVVCGKLTRIRTEDGRPNCLTCPVPPKKMPST